MKKAVIIGAGPIGLYLAYKLRKAGVENIEVCDPRAGEYTRPGHLHDTVFETLESEIGRICKRDKNGHIKDAERFLYEEIKKLKIIVEKHRFIKLNQPGQPKGVFVSTESGEERFIEADYVFDCSGTSRHVVNNLNGILNKDVFQLKQISRNVVAHRHLVAYVNIRAVDSERIENSVDKHRYGNLQQNFDAPAIYPKYIKKLYDLGWQHPIMPLVYRAQFGKKSDKACLYFECPDDLQPSQYKLWMQAAINAVTLSEDISYAELPLPKYAHKPILLSFLVDPHYLQQVSYQHQNFPNIIPLGDALIEPHFVLAHGVNTGIKIVDRLMETIGVRQGEIKFYDSEYYSSIITTYLEVHKKNIRGYNDRRVAYAQQKFSQIKKVYKTAISRASSTQNRSQLIMTLQIIKVHRVYQQMLNKLNEYLSGSLTFKNKYIQEPMLVELYSDLLASITILPSSAIKLREDLLALIPMIASVWKKMGTEQLKADNLTDALYYYQQAVAVQQYILLTDAIKAEKLALYSNIIITLKKLDQHANIVKLSEEVLALFSDSPILTAIETKILFNLIQAYAVVIPTIARESAVELSIRMRDLYQMYQNTFDDQTKRVLAKNMAMFDSYIPMMTAKPSTVGLFSLASGMDVFQATLQAALAPETNTTGLTKS